MFERPWLMVPGGAAYVWPLGTEGFTLTGLTDVAIHKYIGDDEIDVNVMHRDEPRFEMSGLMPGNTAVDNMNSLLEVLRAPTPDRGKILFIPYAFPRQQMVVPLDWNFTHDESDRTRSIAYTVSFLRLGAGRRRGPGAENQNPSANPAPGSSNAGDSARTFTVKDGFRTLRAISKKVYGDPDKWTKLYNLNEKKLKNKGITKQEAATHKLPEGMKLNV